MTVIKFYNYVYCSKKLSACLQPSYDKKLEYDINLKFNDDIWKSFSLWSSKSQGKYKYIRCTVRISWFPRRKIHVDTFQRYHWTFDFDMGMECQIFPKLHTVFYTLTQLFKTNQIGYSKQLIQLNWLLAIPVIVEKFQVIFDLWFT